MATVNNTESDFLMSLIDANELYHNAPCGYCSLLPNGSIIKINKTLLKWLNRHEQDLLGTKLTALLSKGGQMHFEMFFMPMAGVNNAVKTMSYELLGHDGKAIPVLLNARAVLDSNLKLAAINCVLTDNAERQRYEKDILLAKRVVEIEKKRLQFMADLVPEIIWTANNKGFLDYVNARFCQYFNCDGVETRSAFIFSKIHHDDRRNLLRMWRASIHTGCNLETKVRLINTSGWYEWHLLKAAKFMDDDGRLTNWFGSCANINEHVNALNKKDEFINIASHELKTPITSLKAILQLLDRVKSDTSNKMIPGLIEKANRNVNKVNRLVEDLLNASQVNDGRLHLNKTSIDLVELIGDCVHHIRIENKYEIITTGETALSVLADESRIEQVINNFISNAVKYAPNSKKVFVDVSTADGQAFIAITDQGQGIVPEKLPYLFDRYYQVESKTSKYTGLGLGLYICAEIIKKHGGQIGAKSIIGEGSTFWFSLPVL